MIFKKPLNRFNFTSLESQADFLLMLQFDRTSKKTKLTADTKKLIIVSRQQIMTMSYEPKTITIKKCYKQQNTILFFSHWNINGTFHSKDNKTTQKLHIRAKFLNSFIICETA